MRPRSRRRAVPLIGALAVSFVACFAFFGCGTDNGDPEGGTLDSDPIDNPSPDPSGTTRPAFDASFPDEEDAGSDDDPTPDGGDQCIDKDDPGGAENLAKKLKDIDDSDDSGSTVSGVLPNSLDVDFFTFKGTDTLGNEVNPTVSSATSGVEVCMFVACTDGDMDFDSCSGGAQKTSDIGDPGCCAAMPGSTTLTYNCTGTTKESANVFMRVKPAPGAKACLKYSLAYHF